MRTMSAVVDPAASFAPLVDWGFISAQELRAAGEAARVRDLEIEDVLRYDRRIPRRKLLEALALSSGCDWIEYDERIPVPPELLLGLDPERLALMLWFPVALDGETVIVAARHPTDPAVSEDVRECMGEDRQYQFMVALAEEITFFVEDFLNSDPDHLSGNERTSLALWRNTMARWRTKLATYRTDFATVRTYMSFLDAGLTIILVGRTLLRNDRAVRFAPFYWSMIGFGMFLVLLGLISYYRIKRSYFRPPRHQTLIEVTAASVQFLEDYQFVDKGDVESTEGKTMLARLFDLTNRTGAVIEGSCDNKPRSLLAHQRSVFAAQRTVAACYRTIYARARTGLSFIAPGVSFASGGLGLIEYFRPSILNLIDIFLIVLGLLMIVDGIMWSWPCRKENYEALKSAEAF
ncbi:MAG: hypothetical protein P4L43_05740 [Syntrophobacteraceae bacterium]|nr:hypothetical protein [Syntrophobacteraceae bacterium]